MPLRRSSSPRLLFTSVNSCEFITSYIGYVEFYSRVIRQCVLEEWLREEDDEMKLV